MEPKNQAPISSDAQQVETNFDFGISLLKALALDQNNLASSVVWSPFSVQCGFSLLNLGARNKTAEEIAKIFGRGKSAEEIANFYGTTNFLMTKRYINNLYERIKDFCNENGYSILPEFQRLCKQYFGEGCQTSTTNDTSNTSTSQHKTDNKNTISSEDFQIISRFYMVARCPYPTAKKKPFFTSEGNSTQIAQMHDIQKFGYFEDNRVKVLRIDIGTKEREVNLGVILPTEHFGLDKLLQSIDGKTIQKWLENASKKEKVEVRMPKFTAESNHSDLAMTLKSFGLESMFDRSAADFSGISDGHIWIDRVVQEASFKIDEVEAKGAAAKVIGFLGHAYDFVESFFTKIQFIADHPFLYVVVDKQGNLLVVGVFRGN